MNYLEYAKKNRKMAHRTIEERPETERLTTNNSHKTGRDSSMGGKPKCSTNYQTVKVRDEHYYERMRRRHIEKLSRQ
jgi:hypothetical protein